MRRPSKKACAIAALGTLIWTLDGILRPLAWLARRERRNLT